MKIYLAARYSRLEELRQYANDLIVMGCRITSTWLEGHHSIDERGLSIQAADTERQRFATEDYNGVLDANLVISFTEEPRATNGRGGRHVELGIALAVRKRTWIVGPRENVFHHLPQVHQFDNWQEVLEALRREQIVRGPFKK